MNAEIIQGDNLGTCRNFEDSQFQMVLTSPQYDNAREYDGCPALTPKRFAELSSHLYRILTDKGVLCWNVNDMSDGKSGKSLNSFRQALAFQDAGFSVRPMIWEKNFIGYKNKKFYYENFEYVFVCTKSADYTFNPISDVPVSGKNQAFGKNTKRRKDGEFAPAKDMVLEMNPFRMRTNVWKGNTAAQEYPCRKTFGDAPMPEWLARDLILSFSNPGDTVLDPFAGGGTSLKMAVLNGRNALGIEWSERIIRQAETRLKKLDMPERKTA